MPDVTPRDKRLTAERDLGKLMKEPASVTPFKAGEKIVCVDNKGEERWLTIGNEYEAQKDADTSGGRVPYVPVLDDVGDVNWCAASRFTRPASVAGEAKPAEQDAAEEFVQALEEMQKPHNQVIRKLENATRSDRALVDALEEKHADIWERAKITSYNVLKIIAALRTRAEQAEQQVDGLTRTLADRVGYIETAIVKEMTEANSALVAERDALAKTNGENRIHFVTEKQNFVTFAEECKATIKALQAANTSLQEKLGKEEELIQQWSDLASEAFTEALWFTPPGVATITDLPKLIVEIRKRAENAARIATLEAQLAAESDWLNLCIGWCKTAGVDVSSIDGKTFTEHAINLENARWQERLDKLILVVDPDRDGSGCDSGDPLDLTEAELSGAINKLTDERDKARAQLAAERKVLEKIEYKCRMAYDTRFQEGGDTGYDPIDEIQECRQMAYNALASQPTPAPSPKSEPCQRCAELGNDLLAVVQEGVRSYDASSKNATDDMEKLKWRNVAAGLRVAHKKMREAWKQPVPAEPSAKSGDGRWVYEDGRPVPPDLQESLRKLGTEAPAVVAFANKVAEAKSELPSGTSKDVSLKLQIGDEFLDVAKVGPERLVLRVPRVVAEGPATLFISVGTSSDRQRIQLQASHGAETNIKYSKIKPIIGPTEAHRYTAIAVLKHFYSDPDYSSRVNECALIIQQCMADREPLSEPTP